MQFFGIQNQLYLLWQLSSEFRLEEGEPEGFVREKEGRREAVPLLAHADLGRMLTTGLQLSHLHPDLRGGLVVLKSETK